MHSPNDENSKRLIVRSKRLFKHPHEFVGAQFIAPSELSGPSAADAGRSNKKGAGEDIGHLPTTVLPALPITPRPQLWEDMPPDDPDAAIPMDVFDIGAMGTMRLMEVSGMLRAVRPPLAGGAYQERNTPPAVNRASYPYEQQTTIPLSSLFPTRNYPAEMLGPTHILPAIPITPRVGQTQPAWKAILQTPTVRVVLGLLLGVGMLFLISKFVDLPTTISLLRQHLTTTQGALFASLAALSFITAFSIRGARWRLFLSRVCEISTLKAMQIFWVAVFLNFLLPIQGGEVAKSLILKRTRGVPISKSLPTVAMDKSLDLLPALVIMAAVPFLPGIHMSATLWIVLSLVSSILLGIIFTVALMAWNRAAATKFIQLMLKVLPRGIGGRIEGFALGFVDSLLAGASNLRTFIPAVLLTCVAILCDGLFAWFAFLAVGVSSMSFGTAIFGYITYNMFSILPNPPGQVGSNELAGVLVFSGLLGFPKSSILAMFVFSHPLAAVIMTTMCLLCLSGLGISLKSATKLNVRAA